MEDHIENEQSEVASSAIGSYISVLANTALSDRTWIEDRWLDDMRRINGRASTGEVQRKHVHNVTNSKALTAEARISDMLFQQGDKNFTVTSDDVGTDEMATKVEEQVYFMLDACDYETAGRLAIKAACQLGVGVIKGPVPTVGVKKQWNQVMGEDGKPVNALSITIDKSPSVEYVSTWDYFPDMSTANHEDCAYEFQRHWMSKTDLQGLLLRDDFNKEEIIEMIDTEQPASAPRHLVELRDNSLPQSTANTYIVWEGVLKLEKSMLMELCSQEPERGGQYVKPEDSPDADFDIEVYAWVSDTGRLLKLAPNPLETEARPFSVFCYDRDTACFMASRGVSNLLKNAQRDINSSWERINDNSDLSVGPQWIADPSIVEPIPINGETSWNMTANKGWRIKKAGADPNRAFNFFNVPSGVQENMTILKQSLDFAEVETQLPQIASGEQSQAMTKTFSGMELLINASNTVQRRIVKDWDDNVTVPLIDRCIDYVMQNNPIPGVQGVFKPKAQGTSGLLLKETQARNSMNLAQIAGSNPEFARRTDWDKLYAQIIRGLQFDPESVVKSKEQMEAEGQQQKPPNADTIKAQADMIAAQADQVEAQNQTRKMQISEAEAKANSALKSRELQLKEKKAQSDAEIAVMKINVEREKLRLAAVGKEMQLDQQTRAKLAETELKAKSKQDEIILKSKADESKMASEFLLERRGADQGIKI